MPIKPRQIDDVGLFVNDWRESSKFWWLNAPIQPVVMVGSGGRYIKPGMMEDEAFNLAGNVAFANFPEAFEEGQVWIIDHIGVYNGTAAAKLMGVVVVYEGVDLFMGSDAAVGIASPQEMLSQPLMIGAQVGASIFVGGAAADTWSMHARRVA